MLCIVAFVLGKGGVMEHAQVILDSRRESDTL